MEIISTRVRCISGKKAEDVINAINLLPYKIEMKEIIECQVDKRWYAFFVIPDSLADMQMLTEL